MSICYQLTALREHLLTFDEGVSVLRVWESLILAGFKPGQSFTRREASDALAEGVGRPALNAALHFSLDEEPLFRINDSFCLTNLVRIKDGKESALLQDESLSALARKGGTGENPKNRIGAPERGYTMPAIQEVCAYLRLNSQPGDPLRTADLQTVGTYRSGMHRELIRQRTRKKGDQKWQSERLGVTDRTIRHYTKPNAHKR